jgi:hypothetical protein
MSVQKYLKYLNEFFELELSPEKSLVKKNVKINIYTYFTEQEQNQR